MSVIGKIVNKISVGEITKGGEELAVSAATETINWKQSNEMAKSVGDELKKSLESWDGELPEGTKELCVRETQYFSLSDELEHFTCVAYDKNEKPTALHIIVKKD